MIIKPSLVKKSFFFSKMEESYMMITELCSVHYISCLFFVYLEYIYVPILCFIVYYVNIDIFSTNFGRIYTMLKQTDFG